MKKLVFIILVLFNFGCESDLIVGETVSSEEACNLCEEERCKVQINNCDQSDLCGRFNVCIEQKHFTCDQCNSDKDMTSGYSVWKELANCVYLQCSDVCDTSAVKGCSK